MRGVSSVTWRRKVLLVGVTAVAALGCASAASAATYTVNDTRDFPQSTTAASGACVSTAGTCTLRTAFQASNENGGSNTINVPAGTYPITNASDNDTGQCNGTVEDSWSSLKVNQCNNSTAITVIGAGSGSTVLDAQGANRIVDVFQNGSLDVQKMTLENGDGTSNAATTGGVVNDDGGAIDSAGHLSAESATFTGNTGTSLGGGIAAEDVSGSTLSATGDVFQNNSSDDGGAIGNSTPNDASVSFSLFQANNATEFGGAIDHAGGTGRLTLNFDELVQNVAAGDDGGGLFDGSNGELDITNSLIDQNQSDFGGGIDNTPEVTNIANTSFDGNTAAVDGGGFFSESKQLNLTQDKFSGNQATKFGGAVALDNVVGEPSKVTSSEFDGNSAAAGGALDWVSGKLALIGDSFVLNQAGYGGALYAEAGDLLTMVDSTMSRNTASVEGGAIANLTNHLTMTNDTIAFNNAPAGHGGGIFGADGFTSGGSSTSGFGVENTTVAENSGGDCGKGGGAPTFNTAQDTGNNNDSDQTCFGGLGGPHDLVGVNPLLANPANNGGPAAGGPGDTETLQTDAESSNSPLIDAGNNNGCPAVDERGVSRPQGKACDIGGLEVGANPLTSTSTTTTGVTSTTSSTSTVTSTTSTHKPPHRSKRCKKGDHKSHGRCVKNKKHKKHHKKHKK